MSHRVESMLVAGFVLLCILFGGSGQGVWTNIGLQLAGIALIAWAAIAGSRADGGRRFSTLHLLVVLALLLVLIQLVPLPASVWTRLPGREAIARGYELLGYPLVAMPMSETPYASLLGLFAAIPAVALLVSTGRLSPSPRAIAVAIVGGMVAGTFVGALQVAGGPDAWAYFYAIHNAGAVGFFANHNHMATLLLVGIPMTAALMVSAKSKRRSSAVTRYGLGSAVFLLTLVGIVLTGSRAALALSLPVILASATMFPLASRWRGLAIGISAIALLGAVALVVPDPIAASADEASSSRPEIWRTATKAIEDSFPVGTGLGSFESVYHRYEDAGSVTRQYVNHAHNDYLETALELGAAGMVLIAAFLLWWAVTSVRIWLSPVSTPFARAATIATAAVVVHSAVDFPLRTAAISGIFGACLALMAQHLRPAVTRKDGNSGPTRHVSLG